MAPGRQKRGMAQWTVLLGAIPDSAALRHTTYLLPVPGTLEYVHPFPRRRDKSTKPEFPAGPTPSRKKLIHGIKSTAC